MTPHFMDEADREIRRIGRQRHWHRVRLFFGWLGAVLLAWWNETFALHRDLNDIDHWNITHRPTGYAVFRVGLSLVGAQTAFSRLTKHHQETGGWSFTHKGRIPAATRAFGQELEAALRREER